MDRHVSSLQYVEPQSELRLLSPQGKMTWRCVSWVWRRPAWPGREERRSFHGSLRRSGNAAMGSSTWGMPSRASRPGPPTPRPCCRTSSSEAGEDAPSWACCCRGKAFWNMSLQMIGWKENWHLFFCAGFPNWSCILCLRLNWSLSPVGVVSMKSTH